MARREGQASFEYLIIVGLAFLVIIPATYFFFNFSKESGEEISSHQLEALGRTIIDSAESLFYAGEGSKTILRIDIPKGVEKAFIIDQRELVFNVSTSSGYTEFLFISRVNLTTPQGCGQGVCIAQELSESGVKNFRILALNNSVRIEQA